MTPPCTYPPSRRAAPSPTSPTRNESSWLRALLRGAAAAAVAMTAANLLAVAVAARAPSPFGLGVALALGLASAGAGATTVVLLLALAELIVRRRRSLFLPALLAAAPVAACGSAR